MFHVELINFLCGHTTSLLNIPGFDAKIAKAKADKEK